MKKLILSCFLSALCLTTAFAVDYSGTCGENLTWVYDQESCVLTISGTGSMDDYDTQSRPWSSSITDKAKSLVIREGVTTIGKEAFKQFYKLQSISIPTSLQSIGDKAFYSSEHIILSELTGNYSIGEYVFHWNKGITRLTISGNIKIGHYAFQGCDNLQSLTIKDNVSIEGNNAFDSCDRLKNVTIGGNVKLFGRNIFDVCDSLSTVQIQEGIKILPTGLFFRCTQLSNVMLPSSLDTIRDKAFQECDSLKSINLPNNLKYLGDYSFAWSGIQSITLPLNTTANSTSIFFACNNLETAIVYGRNQTYNDLFHNCPNLHTLYWHVKEANSAQDPIGTGHKIKQVFFGEEVVLIPSKMCNAFINLEYAEIQKNVERIGAYAFQNCPKLKKIRSYVTTPPWIGLYGFFMTSNVDSVIVPCNSVEAYQNANFSNAYGWGNMNIVGDDNCGSGTTTYTVSVSSSNTSMGTVSGGGQYEEGATATVIATPKSGYKFTRWSNGNTTNPYSFTVTSNVSLTAYFEQSSTPQPESSTFWNMSDAAFNSLGTISSNKTINGLTIYATSSKNVVIDGSNQEIDGLSFTHRLKLNGTGSSDARLLSFQVDGKCDIDVYLKSGSGSEDRTINVDKGSFGSSLTTIPALSTSISKGTIHYTGGATTIYLYSPSGGVNIYAIRVTSESTPQPTTYTVSVSSANTSMGTVSGGGTYEEGATATVTATPKSGYKFTRWSNGSTANPYSFTVTSDVSLTAYFEQSTTPQSESKFWNISDAAFNSLSTITSQTTINGLTIHATANKPIVVDADAREINGYSFTHRLKFGGTGVNDARMLSFRVDGDCDIDIYLMSASGSADRTLNVDKGSFGNTIQQIPAYGSTISRGNVHYVGGATTIYLYSPSSGVNIYAIQVSYGSAPTPTEPIMVTCAEAAQIASSLSHNTQTSEIYIVTGYITETDGVVSRGQQVFWMADTQNGGKVFESYWGNVTEKMLVGDKVSVEGKIMRYNSTYEIKNGDVTLIERDSPAQSFTVTVSSANSSMGTVSGGGTYEEGQTATVTATPKSGYKFTRWSNGSTANPYSFTVTSDVSLTAYFEQIPASQSESRFWNISDAAFNSLGTITSQTTINGLTIHATVNKPIVVDADAREINGYSFTHRLKFGGTGVNDARMLSFRVDGDCDIDIYLMSASGSADRTLNVDKGSFRNTIQQIPAYGSTISEGNVHYVGGATTIYLYSPSSGVNIYAIRVTYGGKEEGIDDLYVQPQEEASKILRNGQIYILRGEKEYTLTGQEVR